MKWKGQHFERKYEDILQESCEEYLKARRIQYLHLGNILIYCNKCNSKFFRSTSKGGVPDFPIIYTRIKPIAVELKRGKTKHNQKGRIRPEQKNYLESLPQSVPGYVIDNFDDFERLIKHYQDGKPEENLTSGKLINSI